MVLREGATLKQKGFVKELAKTLNGTEAAMRVYDVKNRHVAQNIASENMAKPIVKTMLAEALEKAGMTKDRIAEIAQEAGRANTPIIFEGEVVSEYPAHDTRLKAARLAGELIDAFPAKKHETRSLHANIHVNYTKEELRRLLKGK